MARLQAITKTGMRHRVIVFFQPRSISSIPDPLPQQSACAATQPPEFRTVHIPCSGSSIEIQLTRRASPAKPDGSQERPQRSESPDSLTVHNNSSRVTATSTPAHVDSHIRCKGDTSFGQISALSAKLHLRDSSSIPEAVPFSDAPAGQIPDIFRLLSNFLLSIQDVPENGPADSGPPRETLPSDIPECIWLSIR